MHENSELTNHDCFANVFRERASQSSQQHKSGSSCKQSIRTSRLEASCLMTTQKAMRHRAGVLGLPGKYSTR
jgi:hypothetical protein